MAAANTSVQNFQTATTTATSGTKTFYEGVAQAGEFAYGSERGVRRMELALGSLAAQSVGANHAVGQLAEGFLLFGAGSITTIAILASVAVAFKAFTYELDQTTAAEKRLIDELDKLGPHAKLAADKAAIGLLEESIATWKSWAAKLGTEGIPIIGEAVGGHIIDLQSQLATAQTKLAEDTRKYNNIVSDKAVLEEAEQSRLLELGTRVEEHTAKLLDEESTTKALNAAFEQTTELLLNLQGDYVGAAVAASQYAAASLTVAEVDKEIAEALRHIVAMLDKDAKESERQAKEWGNRIARSLVEGFTGNLNALADLVKSIIEAWLSKNVITPFLVGLGIFSPSTFGMYVGEMLAAGVGQGLAKAELGPMGLNLNLNVNKSGNLSPFDMARDADWQRAFRETALVAHQQGFSLPAPR